MATSATEKMDVEASQMATAELLADAKECGVADGLIQRERQNLATRSDKVPTLPGEGG